MALARVFDAQNWTPQQFDLLMERLIARLNLADGKSAPGVLFHWAAQTAGGMRVVDVYATREAADRLAQDQIGPIARELGLPMPAISEFEIHSMSHA